MVPALQKIGSPAVIFDRINAAGLRLRGEADRDLRENYSYRNNMLRPGGTMNFKFIKRCFLPAGGSGAAGCLLVGHRRLNVFWRVG